MNEVVGKPLFNFRRGQPPAHRLPPFDDTEDDTTDVVAADSSVGGYASFVDAGYPSFADAGPEEEEEVVDEEIAADSDGAAVPVRYVSDGYAPRPSSPTRTSGAGTTTAPSCVLVSDALIDASNATIPVTKYTLRNVSKKI
ncbi:Clathrin light chain [Hordeum vulgare]|nr:Clathrin light chain [Hordeum vulgare]